MLALHQVVRWGADERTNTSLILPDTSNSDVSSCSSLDSDDSSTPTPPVIHFKHSPRSPAEQRLDTPTEQGVDTVSNRLASAEPQIQTPSDIYRVYHKPTRSILKPERSFEEVKGAILTKADKSIEDFPKQPIEYKVWVFW